MGRPSRSDRAQSAQSGAVGPAAFSHRSGEDCPTEPVQAPVMTAMTKARTEANTSPDEGELIARAQRGSHDAFAEIVSRYGERLFLAVQRIVRDSADAEEVVQEAFLKAEMAKLQEKQRQMEQDLQRQLDNEKRKPLLLDHVERVREQSEQETLDT